MRGEKEAFLRRSPTFPAVTARGLWLGIVAGTRARGCSAERLRWLAMVKRTISTFLIKPGTRGKPIRAHCRDVGECGTDRRSDGPKERR